MQAKGLQRCYVAMAIGPQRALRAKRTLRKRGASTSETALRAVKKCRRLAVGLAQGLILPVAGRWCSTVGVDTTSQDRRLLVVSLTTTSDRVGRAHVALESLLRQSLKPDVLILWLSESDPILKPTSDRMANLMRLSKRGLSVKWTQDVGPHTKLLPALREYPKEVIVTADDDVVYPRSWLEKLYLTHLGYPSCIVCYRGWTMSCDPDGNLLPYTEWPEHTGRGPSLSLFPTGRDGVLYPPLSLSREVHDETAMRELAPTADDIWFKVMT